MAFSRTLENTANFLSTSADLLPLTSIGGYANEPFLTIANLALSDLITQENDWKLNRAELPMFVTCSNRLDQLFAGACAFTLGATQQGWGIDLASNVAIITTGGVTNVTTLENHRFAVGDVVYLTGVTAATNNPATPISYNSIFTDTGSETSWTNGYTITFVGPKNFTFASVSGMNNGDVLGAPGINDYFALSSGSVVQMYSSSSPQYGYGITCYRELPVSTLVSNPAKIAVLTDFGNGILKIRMNDVPGTVCWGVNLVYQKQAPTKVSLGDNWAPFPDHFVEVYTQAVVARMHAWMGWPTAAAEYLKLEKAIMKQQAADDSEESSVSLIPDEPIMGYSGDGTGWGW